ncbi:MAG: hypothetical protein NTY07_07775 [Bacteroidia bacterium]|nr:hypothetical protein [Bacteroidia bacterium]
MIIEVLAFKFNFFTFTKVPFNKGYLVLVAMIMALFIIGCSRSSRHEVQPTISIVPTAEIPLSLLLPEKGSVTVHFGFDSQIADKIKKNPEYSSILDKLKDPQTGKVPEILLKELMNFSVTSDDSNDQALGDAFKDMLTKGSILKVSTRDLVIDIDHDPKRGGKGSLHIQKITPGKASLILSKYNIGETSDYSVVMTADIKINEANGSIFLTSCPLSDITMLEKSG